MKTLVEHCDLLLPAKMCLSHEMSNTSYALCLLMLLRYGQITAMSALNGLDQHQISRHVGYIRKLKLAALHAFFASVCCGLVPVLISCQKRGQNGKDIIRSGRSCLQTQVFTLALPICLTFRCPPSINCHSFQYQKPCKRHV